MKKGSLNFQVQFSKNWTKKGSTTSGMIRKIRKLLHNYQLQGRGDGSWKKDWDSRSGEEWKDEWFI